MSSGRCRPTAGTTTARCGTPKLQGASVPQGLGRSPRSPAAHDRRQLRASRPAASAPPRRRDGQRLLPVQVLPRARRERDPGGDGQGPAALGAISADFGTQRARATPSCRSASRTRATSQVPRDHAATRRRAGRRPRTRPARAARATRRRSDSSPSTSRSCSTASSSRRRTSTSSRTRTGSTRHQRRRDLEHRLDRRGEGPRARAPDRRAARQVPADRADQRLGDARQGLARARR